MFGRRQDPNPQYAAVIPKFIKILKANEQVEIYGDGEQSRDFTYIENVIGERVRILYNLLRWKWREIVWKSEAENERIQKEI